MEKFLQLLAALKIIQRDFNEIAIDIIKNNESKVIQLNLENLLAGKNGEGEQIKPDYAQSTIARKKRVGQPTNRVTLKDKGEFYLSIQLRYSKDEIEFVTDDKKAIYLFNRYGKNVLGLDSDGIATLKELIVDQISENLKMALI